MKIDRLTDAVERLGEMVEYLEAVEQDYILVGGRKLHTDDLRLALSALEKSMTDHSMKERP